MRRILDDEIFFRTLPQVHKEALNALKDVVDNFLGNIRATNYVQLVQKLLETYKEIGALMSLKMHFLKNHLLEFAVVKTANLSLWNRIMKIAAL